MSPTTSKSLCSFHISWSVLILHVPCSTTSPYTKQSPLQAWTGPVGLRWLRLPDFKTIGTWRWYGCQPYAPAACTPQDIYPVLICVGGWVNARAIERQEWCQWKIPMTYPPQYFPLPHIVFSYPSLSQDMFPFYTQQLKSPLFHIFQLLYL